MSETYHFEIPPPPKRRSKIVLDEPQISAPVEKISKSTATATLGGKAPPKKSRPRRIVQTRAEADTMKLPVLSSLAAVESYAHVPKALLSEMRKRNCTAFDPHGSGRVDVDLLFRWMFTHMTWLFPGEKKDETALGNLTWKGRTERANAILKEIAADEAQERIVDRGEIITALSKGTAALFNALEREITLTLPATLRGLGEQQIRDRLVAACESFKNAFRSEL